ncbi:uncharacterized protein LOC109133844 [Beta vulgaris subsp. vulgaris]|uniref:uncharacterized protein LOC109133844 n=1 Tax=Beta vulgaris subsp. vulgaris TaxID=3555 RepID=UPI000901EAA0|nr:uncharacterized protein LOC109133844 [Beta vulgaris subsp. vulgaris]
MYACSWNVRGLNDHLKIKEVKSFIAFNKFNIFALTETRAKLANKDKVQKKFGNSWQWGDNYSHNPKGRIWLAWKPTMIHVDIMFTSDQVIHSLITDKNTQYKMYFTAVYGSHSIENKKPLWKTIHFMATHINLEWIIMGDFNSVLESDDRINGVPISTFETQDFRYLRDHTDLLVVKGIGGSYTWSNKREGMDIIFSRIDRCLSWRQKRVAQNLADIWFKLKDVSKVLKHLQVTQFANAGAACIESLKKWLNIEESIYKQKSRIQWLQAGDSNNKVFFTAMKERQAWNSIDVLYSRTGAKLD